MFFKKRKLKKSPIVMVSRFYRAWNPIIKSMDTIFINDLGSNFDSVGICDYHIIASYKKNSIEHKRLLEDIRSHENMKLMVLRADGTIIKSKL